MVATTAPVLLPSCPVNKKDAPPVSVVALARRPWPSRDLRPGPASLPKWEFSAGQVGVLRPRPISTPEKSHLGAGEVPPRRSGVGVRDRLVLLGRQLLLTGPRSD